MSPATADRITTYVIVGWFLGSLLVLVGWDVIAFHVGGLRATETDHIRRWSRPHPLIPFLYGAITMGLAFHFWPL